MVTAPIVGAGRIHRRKLYWRTTADNGKTYQWLLDKEGKMMPVGGVPPAMDIDAEGFWIVDGQRLTDKEGNQYWPTMSATPSSRRWRPTKRA